MQKHWTDSWIAVLGASLILGMISTIAAHAEGSVSDSDKQFMITAASGGNGEVELGKLAAQKASDPSVKTHAQHMVDDHTKAGNELKTIATAKGVTLPSEPDAKSKALIEKLKDKSGSDFDSTYVSEAGVKAHKEMKTVFQQESSGGSDTEVKNFASKTLPVVEQHLQMSERLEATVGPAKN